MWSSRALKRQLQKALPIRTMRGSGKTPPLSDLPALRGKPKAYTFPTPTSAETSVFSRGELLAMQWLTKQGIAFSPQVPIMGGRTVRGGRVLDIVVTENIAQPLVIRVQSERYHMGSSQLEGQDLEEKIMLINMGYEVVDVWEERLLASLDYVMSNALMGIEVGR